VPTTTHLIGKEKLIYKDAKGVAIELPFVLENAIVKDDYSKVQINGRAFTFHLFKLTPSRMRLQYISGTYDSNAAGNWANVDFTSGEASGPIYLDVGASSGEKIHGGKVAYLLRTDYYSTYTALVLGLQQFDLYDDEGKIGELFFLGTDTNEDGFISPGGRDKQYYEPHSSSLGYTDDKAFNVAQFSLKEAGNNDGVVRQGDVQFNIDTSTGNVLNIEAIKSDGIAYSYSFDASYYKWTNAIRDGAGYSKTGVTDYGSEISSDNAKFTIALPVVGK
jgi:hypothetical protein